MAVSPVRHVALGGIGGDSHSVGLTILRQALVGNGFLVHFMGTQNSLESFFVVAPSVDVVMVSCMDGHLRHYLNAYPELRRRHGDDGALWYAGGNIALHKAKQVRDEARRLGFARVFTGYVDIATVLDTLKVDLTGRPRRYGPPVAAEKATRRLLAPPGDERLGRTEFAAERGEVIEQWPTGAQARDLGANARFLRRQQSFPAYQMRAARAGRTLVQPRSGVALAEEQLAAFHRLRDHGADVLSYQVDSLTRNNFYAAAARGIQQSRESGDSMLNGFPVVNHGVPVLRRISAELGVPLQVRHSTRDPRLLAEISCAGGSTAYEGGAITYNIPYFKDYALDLALHRWRYVDRLVGIYAEDHGVIIDREFFGTLTAVLIPPSLAVVVNLIEAMLAVSQGVRSVSLGYAEQGNRAQDIAAVRVLRELSEKYLANLGHIGVSVNTVFHQYMAAFPANLTRARRLIAASGATARLSGATRVLVKTPVEATTIPSIRDNADGMALARMGMESAARIEVDERAVAAEVEIIRAEADQMFESVLLCGGGSLTEGVVRAFAQGFLDIPFAPSAENRGEVMTARDAAGAVRYLRHGRLQFSHDIVRFNRDKIAERRSRDGSPSRSDWELVEHDVLRVPSEYYERWPLND